MMNIDVDRLVERLKLLKSALCSVQSFEQARVAADAVIVIEHLRKRPPSPEELALLETERIKKAHLDALEAVFHYFNGRLNDAELLDPTKVCLKLTQTIKDLT